MSDPIKSITDAAKRLADVREVKANLEAQLKEVNKEKEDLEARQLPKLMDEQEIEKLTIEGVGTLYLESGVYAYIMAADRGIANDWLRSNGHGDIIKETIHHGTLKSWVKEQLGNGQPVPEFFNAKPIQTARIRRK